MGGDPLGGLPLGRWARNVARPFKLLVRPVVAEPLHQSLSSPGPAVISKLNHLLEEVAFSHDAHRYGVVRNTLVGREFLSECYKVLSLCHDTF